MLLRKIINILKKYLIKFIDIDFLEIFFIIGGAMGLIAIILIIFISAINNDKKAREESIKKDILNNNKIKDCTLFREDLTKNVKYYRCNNGMEYIIGIK